MDSNTLTAILTACCSLLVSVSSLLITRIKLKTAEARLSQIEKSDLEGLYVICPGCGKKVYLSENTINKEVTIK